MKMKKYMTPEMEVIELKIQSLICVSGGGDEEGESGSGDMGGGTRW